MRFTNMMGIIIAQCSFIANRNIIILKPKITVYVHRKLKITTKMPPSRDSMAYTKGLLNRPGQNNCFLNSAVQVKIYQKIKYFLATQCTIQNHFEK